MYRAPTNSLASCQFIDTLASLTGARFDERSKTMSKALLVVLAVILLIVGYLFIQSLPDIQRYLRIRSM